MKGYEWEDPITESFIIIYDKEGEHLQQSVGDLLLGKPILGKDDEAFH